MKFALRTLALAAALIVSLASPAGYAVEGMINPADIVPSAPDVKTGKLANGLTYYIKPNARPVNKLELRLVVRAGSVLEDEDQRGLAHFVEHMAFNGTTHFKRHELTSYLQSIGVKFGADLNAYTSFDETVYMLPIPTEKKENIATGFQVLEDWAHGVLFEDDAIDAERKIVLEELRARGGVEKRMLDAILPKMLNGSLYAERQPGGKEEVLKQFTPDALKRFYRDWYRPDLMAVVVVGDIDPAQAEQLVQRHFGHLKNPESPRQRWYPDIPARAQSEALVVLDKEATNNSLSIRYAIRTDKEQKTFADYRAQLADGIVGFMLSQRIAELNQQAEPPFINGAAGLGTVVTGYRAFNASAVLGKGGAVPAIDALVQEIERARRFGFTQSELERTRKIMLRFIERAYNERDKSESSYFARKLVGSYAARKAVEPGIANEYAWSQQLVPAISLEEVNAAARALLPTHEQKLVIYHGNEQSEAPPQGGNLLAALDAAESRIVKAADEKIYASQLMEQLPKPGNIVKETVNKALGTTELRLSNGVRVVLKPTDFKNEQVLMTGYREGGQSLYDVRDMFNARYASAIVGHMGVLKFAPLELQKILAGKAVSAYASLAPLNEGFGGSAASADVETMLQLLHLEFTQPRRDDALFQSFIGKQRDLARTTLSNPDVAFADASIATLLGDHPRLPRLARVEDFDQVQLDRVMDIYKERFASAKGFTFFLVGSFDPAKIKPLIATYLASLPVPDLPVKFRDLGVRPVKGVVKKEVFKGTEPRSQVVLTFTGETVYSEEAAMRQEALAEILNIKLNDVLREKLGLIYSGQVGAQMNKLPYGNYVMTVQLPCAPENADKVADAMLALVRQIQEQGPDAADLAKVRANWLTTQHRAMRDNGYWLTRLLTTHVNGTDPASLLKFDQRVAAIKPAEIQAAARRYFNMENYVHMVLYPEPKQLPPRDLEP